MDEGTMKLLLTVARLSEVPTALRAGADVVDVKDPGRGSLGRPRPGLVAEVVRRCGGHRPVSVALGDGPHDPEELAAAAGRALRAGAAYLKVGLLGGAPGAPPASGGHAPPAGALQAVAERLASSGAPARLVAVTFADARAGEAPAPEALAALAREHGADGVMLDTLSKDAGSILRALGPGRLKRWAAAARRRGLEAAVAGGLDETSIPGLGGLGLGVVGVRGGACSGGRDGRLDPDRCRAVRRAVDAASAASPATA